MSSPSVLAVDALYPASGITADALASRAVGCVAYPVCTAIVMASRGLITDVTDVPADTVAAQIAHLMHTVELDALKIGVLSSHQTAEAVLSFARTFEGPVLLDVKLSGSCGETVLTSRGIDVLRTHLGDPTVVTVGRTDAELLSEGEITSLDDAQIAAQRIVRRHGVRALVIKCGPLPARFHDAGIPVRDDGPFNADLFFDGEEFALFEAPHIIEVPTDGASSVFAVPILKALIEGRSVLEAVQTGKGFVTEALRSTQRMGAEAPLQYFWQTPPPPAESSR